jgi:hypothetical protein
MITADERRQIERDYAEAGVALLVLLGLRQTGQRVEWDSRLGQFRIDGRLVSPETIRRVMNRVVSTARTQILLATELLISGSYSNERWLKEMRRILKGGHAIASGLAFGGLDSTDGFLSFRERYDEEDDYLIGFWAAWGAGGVSPARAVARSVMYASAIYVTWQIATGQQKKGAGFTEAMRIRTAAESCPGCIQYAGRWIPISQMPPIGSLQCRSNCKCYIIYR